ncbi:MAG: hypothetical protein QOC96_3760 [Acidobacteriota bacterium]|nr:hypothetical protein [Acidobacteriota bacterium]
MKRCPSCNRTFEDDAYSVCPVDTTPLVSDSAALNQGTLNLPASVPEQRQSWQPLYVSQQTQAHGSGNRKIWIGIAAVVLVLVAVSLILVFTLSGKSLGKYEGSLRDLFPEKIGNFKRVSPPSHWNADVLYLKYKDSYLAMYEIPHSDPKDYHCDSTVRAYNFTSADEAKEGMRVFKRQELPDTPDLKVTEKTTSAGDWSEIIWDIPTGRQFAVLWTNGSVFFFLENTDMPRGGEQTTQCGKDIRDFENNFSYSIAVGSDSSRSSNMDSPARKRGEVDNTTNSTNATNATTTKIK